MANRPFFCMKHTYPFFEEKTIDFKYENGFSLSQSQKCIRNLHLSIKEQIPNAEILEVSTKSENPLGLSLSAFNLNYPHKNYKLENVFQSSKKFDNGGPYRELLKVSPSDAKHSPLLKESGSLTSFISLDGTTWPLVPETAFYDWIYIQSVDNYFTQNSIALQELLSFTIFTDIAFNPKKSINCQARALSMYVGLTNAQQKDFYLKDRDSFLQLYHNREVSAQQISMFD